MSYVYFHTESKCTKFAAYTAQFSNPVEQDFMNRFTYLFVNNTIEVCLLLIPSKVVKIHLLCVAERGMNV